MKTKLNTLQVLMMAGLLSATACNNADSNKAENMEDTATVKVENAMQDVKEGAQNAAAGVKDALNGNQDSNFVVKATKTNMTELKVLQAGWDNGTNKELKGHAKMMIADHKKLGDKVKAYAAKKNYALPDNDGGDGDETVAKLNKNTKGAEWDKAWVDHMVSAHEDAIKMFETASNDVKDADLKALATDALPTLRSHLDMMKQMQDKMKK